MQLPDRGAADPAALALEVDVDAVELRLRPCAVVVQKAENLPVSCCHEKLGVGGLRTACDALGERRDRIRLLHDRGRERGADDRVVRGRESHPANRADRRRVRNSRRSNGQVFAHPRAPSVESRCQLL